MPLTSEQVKDILADMVVDMAEYKVLGDHINESRQKLVLGLKLQAGEHRRYLIGDLLMEIACDDKGEYTFKPATVEP